LIKRISEISAALQGRQLVYFGTRGADAESLLSIPNFSSIFSLIAPLHASTVEETCLENLTRERVELDEYSIDLDQRPIVSEMRRKLLRTLDEPSIIMTYRPCAFLSSAWFPRSDRVKYLGLFHAHQACFEHKAWVETQLAAAGVPVLSWRFFADEETQIIKEWAETEPLVLRANRSDGGVGVRFVDSPESLKNEWPSHADGFLSVTPFLDDCISLNLNACVYTDGSVSFHGPSLQLIGIKGLTTRRFGYCGNDFAAAAPLDSAIWDELEQATTLTARWLRSQGYLGVFGVDALVHEGRLFITEVNPRFQGSSMLSARIDKQLNRSNMFTEHIAAFLGMPAPPMVPIRELAKAKTNFAHTVVHNICDTPVYVRSNIVESESMECRLVPEADILLPTDSIIFDVVFPHQVTTDGESLLPEVQDTITALTQKHLG